MAKAGAYRPFGLGQEDIKEMAGIDVDSKAIERISHQLGEEVEGFYRREGSQFLSGKVVPLQPVTTMYICMDATGVPVVKAETATRKGKGQQGQAKTREAKLGCVFTQTTVDEKGYPKRDEDSTSYVGAIETTEAFGNRMDTEALRRGLERAQRVCAIGDAAPWIWNIVEEHFDIAEEHFGEQIEGAVITVPGQATKDAERGLTQKKQIEALRKLLVAAAPTESQILRPEVGGWIRIKNPSTASPRKVAINRSRRVINDVPPCFQRLIMVSRPL
jgi:hypothetical protein